MIRTGTRVKITNPNSKFINKRGKVYDASRKEFFIEVIVPKTKQRILMAMPRKYVKAV